MTKVNDVVDEPVQIRVFLKVSGAYPALIYSDNIDNMGGGGCFIRQGYV